MMTTDVDENGVECTAIEAAAAAAKPLTMTTKTTVLMVVVANVTVCISWPIMDLEHTSLRLD